MLDDLDKGNRRQMLTELLFLEKSLQTHVGFENISFIELHQQRFFAIVLAIALKKFWLDVPFGYAGKESAIDIDAHQSRILLASGESLQEETLGASQVNHDLNLSLVKTRLYLVVAHFRDAHVADALEETVFAVVAHSRSVATN